MISLILNRSAAPQEESVRLKLPATPGEIGKAYKALDLLDGGPIAIFDAECSIPNLRNYIIYAEFNDHESFEQLQELARRIAGMSRKEQALFSGAIENESIHSLADILSISEHLDRYVLLLHIDSDAALGRFLVDSGFKNCPEDMQAYLNYDAIGRDYRSEYGGAFGYGGFVRQKETADLMPDVDAIITLQLKTASANEPYFLKLPATEAQLNNVRQQLNIEEFSEAFIIAIEFDPEYLADSIPTECVCVGTANDLALEIENMQQTDGELLKYLSAIEIEQPQTFTEALNLAINIGNYERVAGSAYEYGQIVLRRLGANTELLDVLDSYMDFAEFGQDAMEEDHVCVTQYGMIRRCHDSQAKGSVKHACNLNGSVRNWYISSFPGDDQPPTNCTLTFRDVIEALNDKQDIYDALGVMDSVVRERVFAQTAELLDVDYNTIYEKWLYRDTRRITAKLSRHLSRLTPCRYKVV